MAIKRLLNVQAGLLWKPFRSLFNRGAIKYLICVEVVSEHLFKLVIDLLVQVQKLSVRDLEDPLRILLAEYFFYLFVEITHAHQVSVFQVLV